MLAGDRFDRVVTAHAQAEGITEAEVHRIYLSGTSMQCYVDPQEVADMICFLCSDHSRHVSGQVIAIDGNTENTPTQDYKVAVFLADYSFGPAYSIYCLDLLF